MGAGLAARGRKGNANLGFCSALNHLRADLTQILSIPDGGIDGGASAILGESVADGDHLKAGIAVEPFVGLLMGALNALRKQLGSGEADAPP